MVSDRAISSEFLTRRVAQHILCLGEKFQFSTTFGGHLGFQRKMKNCEYLAKGISSRVMLGGKDIPRQWSCFLLFLDDF